MVPSGRAAGSGLPSTFSLGNNSGGHLPTRLPARSLQLPTNLATLHRRLQAGPPRPSGRGPELQPPAGGARGALEGCSQGCLWGWGAPRDVAGARGQAPGHVARGLRGVEGAWGGSWSGHGPKTQGGGGRLLTLAATAGPRLRRGSSFFAPGPPSPLEGRRARGVRELEGRRLLSREPRGTLRVCA